MCVFLMLNEISGTSEDQNEILLRNKLPFINTRI